MQYPKWGTLLQVATALGRAEAVDWLLNQGADANATAGDLAPLSLAVLAVTEDPERKIRIMQSLLDHGAAIDLVNKNGMTALHVAAATYSKKIVEFLLHNGADPLKRNKDGWTPMQLAQRSGFGTGLLGIATPGDLAEKVPTIEVLRTAARNSRPPQ